MLAALFVSILAFVSTVVQIGFLSHFGFPWATLSFPLVAVAYGVVRDRPLLALGWALIAGFLLDLHGLLGFGAEIAALFTSYFASRFLFQRVLTNTGTVALFLLGAISAIIHWFLLMAIDGIGVLFGAIPTMIDLSLMTFFAPIRQALIAGAALLIVIKIEQALSRRFRKSFLSHGPSTVTFS
jgi:hypothetical protein